MLSYKHPAPPISGTRYFLLQDKPLLLCPGHSGKLRA
jgi:hypothetical protein